MYSSYTREELIELLNKYGLAHNSVDYLLTLSRQRAFDYIIGQQNRKIYGQIKGSSRTGHS